MKGRICIEVRKRKVTDSWRYADKYSIEDELLLYCIINKENNKKYFKVLSIKKQYKPIIISRDELAFVKLLYMYYGSGDFYIQCWGKGKNRGRRNFWDGVLSPEKKFFRRRVSYSINPTTKTKTTESIVSGDFIGRYMRTKQPGRWYSF